MLRWRSAVWLPTLVLAAIGLTGSGPQASAETQADAAASKSFVGRPPTNTYGSGTTSPAALGVALDAGDPVVAAAGDIAKCTHDDDEATAQLLDSIAPSAVLTLGDNAYSSGTDAQFADCYQPTWGRHKAKTYPAPGNHDYQTPGAAGYFTYFGAAAGDPTKGYYAFDLGAWRFYALNSNCTQVSCAAGDPQEQWLRADLAANPRTCTAAFMHHPRFASGESGGRRDNPSMGALYQAFYEASGDLWLVGHNHQYERLTRLSPTGAIDLERGVRNFVAGTGGAALYAFGPPNTGSEVRSATRGVLKLTLHAGGYDWEFVPVAGSMFTDAGTDLCGAAPPDTTPPSDPTGLAATSTGAGNVGLSWSASLDDVSSVTYDVYRDAQLLASVTTTDYTDSSAVAGATYVYYVKARDAANNVSGSSNTVTVTVEATTVVIFAAEADARVAEARPAKNFGTTPFLRTDAGSDPDVESYLRFSVSVSGPIQRAILRVYAYNATIDGPAVYGTSNAWAEMGITWSTRPAPTTGGLGDKGAIARNTWVEYDVTSLVPANGTFSFVLATTSTDHVDFHSREASQTALRPQLVVTVG